MHKNKQYEISFCFVFYTQTNTTKFFTYTTTTLKTQRAATINPIEENNVTPVCL